MSENKTEKTYETVQIDHGIFDYFPVILDYDCTKKRPRGLSARVDFFSYGTMCDILDSVDLMPHVFIKKKDTFFENGMILVDFSKVIDNPSEFLGMVKNLKSSVIYLESSKKYPLDKVVAKLKNVDVIFMEASK